MENVKVVKVCPVCQSKDIIQNIRSFMGFGDRGMIFGNGSHCGNCGVKFVFNSAHLKRELNREATLIKRAKDKAKR